MKKIYLDTSAFFKIFVEEEATEVVERLILLAKEKKIQIVLSDWTINESIALVDENKRKGKITQAETQTILSEIVSMIKQEVEYENFVFVPITGNAIIESRIIIQDYHIAASDALHVFISGASQCDYFISADAKLVNQLTLEKDKRFIAYNIRIDKDAAKLFSNIENS